MNLSLKEIEMLQMANSRNEFSITTVCGRKRTGGKVPSAGKAELNRSMKLEKLGLIKNTDVDTYRDTSGGYTTFYATYEFILTDMGKELLK